MKTFKTTALISLVLAFSGIYISAQQSPAIDVASADSLDKVRPVDSVKPGSNIVLNNISSTAAGGPWSSPSTWVGGVVPGSGDSVTIVGGSAVMVDTSALAGTLTVGSGGSPAVLTFDPGTARSLTVSGDLTINGATDILTTPTAGTVTGHTIAVGGSLTNNGILDLSTNSDQAGADLTFTGAANNTFGGSGPVTDIRTITMNKGTSRDNILDLTVSNFTVRGGTTDSAASAFLTLNNGTFKISGTFTGSHRTTGSANYTVPVTAGFWLNNPNYTVAAQHGSLTFSGLLRVSAGKLNVGTAAEDTLGFTSTTASTAIIEGGEITVSGGFGLFLDSATFTYNQSGGKVTSCVFPDASACFSLRGGAMFGLGESVTMSGGDVVIQNASTSSFEDYSYEPGNEANILGLTGTTIHFGNGATVSTDPFTAVGLMPNIAIDTTVGPQKLLLDPRHSGGANNLVRNVNIGVNGTLEMATGSLPPANLVFDGDTFVNNGTLKVINKGFVIHGSNPAADVTFSGTGVASGTLTSIYADCHSATFDPSFGNFRAFLLEIHGADLINSSKITLGQNSLATVNVFDNGKFDSTPLYDVGATGVAITYHSDNTTGCEIPANRILNALTFATIHGTVDGGDLTVTGNFNVSNILSLGTNKLTHLGQTTSTQGYVDGTMIRPFTAAGQLYTYIVGQNFRSIATVTVNGIQTNPTDLAVTAIDSTLSGLPAGTSASRHWKLESTGNLSGGLQLQYDASDVSGSAGNYRLWRSVGGGPPVLCPNSSANTASRRVSCSSIPDLSGDWGIAEWVDPGPITLSGRIVTANGAGISNSLVTLSGGNLPAPITVQTGTLGYYIFQNIPAGQAYTITAGAKRYRFDITQRSLVPTASMADLDFVARAQD
jgi:hypothetical protein